MVVFEKCEFDEIKDKLCRYYQENDILIESFFEEHVISSDFFHIVLDEEKIGYCGIYNKKLLTSFGLDNKYNYLAQDIFTKAKYLEQVSEALVPTGDEFLLSLCLDDFDSLHKQAYFTRDLDLNNENNCAVNLRLAIPSDAQSIEKYSEDFFDDINKYINNKFIYIAEKDNELVGFGIIEPGIIRNDLQSIGMYVREEYRRQGIGTCILNELKKIVKVRNKKAISGCWYHNYNSLRTQFKSGNYCWTRLLKVKF
ncbi:GNAT family N-acetyltransferase [Clostridium saccharoperbutylacetonicum]|uniref:GNAT family N-acetyltransferase n=1 Tax=Clostridium saccharoperbutylacetonicum TaxID=36745 RepID=UPI000983C8F6|nr:GNAT family N-acetyltransferase [Clostridium saccharoperbutylacetonicum]AQR96313.1 acetyltransferase (GNAT) family protein [Clostridium saccharoperbutylacetonicum]NSB32186.1 GNAT superfamily N-acetyltransferase [Clostridium saccharoperbutylacetonicum]